MDRFMGMMSSSEVKIQKQYRVGFNQLIVTVQAGPRGWTIIYADSSSEYVDNENTTENNLAHALEVLKTHFEEINEI